MGNQSSNANVVELLNAVESIDATPVDVSAMDPIEGAMPEQPRVDPADSAVVDMDQRPALNSTIEMDLLDFDTAFPCPVCEHEGIASMLTVLTVSGHMYNHKLMEDDDDDDYEDDDDETTDETTESESDEESHPESEYNQALRESHREALLANAFHGGLSDEDAMAAALAESQLPAPGSDV